MPETQAGDLLKVTIKRCKKLYHFDTVSGLVWDRQGEFITLIRGISFSPWSKRITGVLLMRVIVFGCFCILNLESTLLIIKNETVDLQSGGFDSDPVILLSLAIAYLPRMCCLISTMLLINLRYLSARR